MELSFILGAGFSFPEGYPTRKEINERMREISHEEIMIHTDGTALFLNGNKDENADTNLRQKFFLEKFINYYTSRIIPKIEDFDYEYFFDYYQGLIKGRYKCSVFEKFTENFRKQYATDTDNLNLLSDFHNTFNQLVESLLSKGKPSNVLLQKPYQRYPGFLNYIDDIKDSFSKIHFHTLNHDLLLEELANSEAIGTFSDGYELFNSPFYSKCYEDNSVVQLERFTDKFDTKFCIYKLHGSIDHYIYDVDAENKASVKIPYGIDFVKITKKYLNKNGEMISELCFWNYYSDFLSGTTDKILSYWKDYYYKTIFNHFICNLKNSDYLISIGYGLKDSKINEFIIEHFLKDKNKKMLIITPHKPESELFNYPNVIYYGEGKGIESIQKEEVDKHLK